VPPLAAVIPAARRRPSACCEWWFGGVSNQKSAPAEAVVGFCWISGGTVSLLLPVCADDNRRGKKTIDHHQNQTRPSRWRRRRPGGGSPWGLFFYLLYLRLLVSQAYSRLTGLRAVLIECFQSFSLLATERKLILGLRRGLLLK
jgi:hypothetical protein